MVDSVLAYNEARQARKGRVLIYRRVVTESQTLNLPQGIYDIIAIGTGGSGGRATNSGSARSTGGGGPAWARDWGRFDAPTAVAITIGARAAGVVSGSGAADGNDGGTTTVTGIADPITLTGGKAGKASLTAVALNGGDGGVATGGKVRANGGRGGNIETTAGGAKATGAGAADIFCLGTNVTRGGDFKSTSTSSTTISTGGAGLGGRGGDHSGAVNNINTGGGGAGGDALDNVSQGQTTNGPTVLGVRGEGIAPSDAEVADLLMSYPGVAPIGSGASAGTTPKNGGGTGGSSGAPGRVPFGGQGGITTTGSGFNGTEFGGGSGGVASPGTAAAVSPPAGQAIVIVSVYRETA